MKKGRYDTVHFPKGCAHRVIFPKLKGSDAREEYLCDHPRFWERCKPSCQDGIDFPEYCPLDEVKASKYWRPNPENDFRLVDLYLYMQLFHIPNYDNTFSNRMYVQEAVFYGKQKGLPFHYEFDMSYKVPYSKELTCVFCNLSEHIKFVREKAKDMKINWYYEKLIRFDEFDPIIKFKLPVAIKNFKQAVYLI